MDRELDVFNNYRTINNKIKKRFLKKPNFNEASEQFGTLTRVLKQQECPQYAGFCCLAKARCENTLGNPVAEAESLLEAARLFFDAEKRGVDARCAARDGQLPEAVHCYNQAVKLYRKEGNVALAATVALETANNLLSIGHTDEALNHFLRAAEIQREINLFDSLCTLQKAAYCKVEMKDHQGALDLLGTVMETIESIVTQDNRSLTYSLYRIRQSIEISRVFVLLLLQTSPMKNEHSKVIEAYTWDNDEENKKVLPEEIFLLIQSVVMATQARDGDALMFLQNQLYIHLDAVQCDLMQRIVHEFKE